MDDNFKNKPNCGVSKETLDRGYSKPMENSQREIYELMGFPYFEDGFDGTEKPFTGGFLGRGITWGR